MVLILSSLNPLGGSLNLTLYGIHYEMVAISTLNLFSHNVLVPISARWQADVLTYKLHLWTLVEFTRLPTIPSFATHTSWIIGPQVSHSTILCISQAWLIAFFSGIAASSGSHYITHVHSGRPCSGKISFLEPYYIRYVPASPYIIRDREIDSGCYEVFRQIFGLASFLKQSLPGRARLSKRKPWTLVRSIHLGSKTRTLDGC